MRRLHSLSQATQGSILGAFLSLPHLLIHAQTLPSSIYPRRLAPEASLRLDPLYTLGLAFLLCLAHARLYLTLLLKASFSGFCACRFLSPIAQCHGRRFSPSRGYGDARMWVTAGEVLLAGHPTAHAARVRNGYTCVCGGVCVCDSQP